MTVQTRLAAEEPSPPPNFNGADANFIPVYETGATTTVDGACTVALEASGETPTLGNGGSTVLTAAGVQNETIDGSDMSITLSANVQVTINGSNDTISGIQGGDNVTINGSDDDFTGNGDDVDFEGDAGSDSETGADDSFYQDGRYYGGTDATGEWSEDPYDPLVLNLRGGSVQTVGAAQSSARFDFRGNGAAVETGWGTAGEGYLVDAPDGQTRVTDGRDLVSSFASLQKLDSNHDDRIDASDARWNDLKVWVDQTGTAAFQAGSLRSLSDLGITSIDLDPPPDRHAENGNMILAQGTFTWRDGSTGRIADVDFGTPAGSARPQQAVTSGTTADLRTATGAAQLVSAMSTFGATTAAETPTQALDRPTFLPLGVDAGRPAHRHAA